MGVPLATLRLTLRRRGRGSRWSYFGLFLLIGVSCGGPSASPPASMRTSPEIAAAGQIAFHSDRDGNTDIYVMNADGSGVTRLTDDPAIDGWPTWSPDGTRIAFQTEPSGRPEIDVMNTDGTGVMRLTENGVEPAWSPDGTKIAFESSRDGSELIYVMNTDGTAVTRLTDEPAHDTAPAWSPDGTKIAFERWAAALSGELLAAPDIYVVNADGTGLTRLTDFEGFDTDPAWSPDGTKIAFASDRDAPQNHEIYVMNADGTGLTRLTDDPASDDVPTWSPDGTRIAFETGRDGNLEIYVMNADGTGVTRLTNDPADDSTPAWSSANVSPP